MNHCEDLKGLEKEYHEFEKEYEETQNELKEAQAKYQREYDQFASQLKSRYGITIDEEKVGRPAWILEADSYLNLVGDGPCEALYRYCSAIVPHLAEEFPQEDEDAATTLIKLLEREFASKSPKIPELIEACLTILWGFDESAYEDFNPECKGLRSSNEKSYSYWRETFFDEEDEEGESGYEKARLRLCDFYEEKGISMYDHRHHQELDWDESALISYLFDVYQEVKKMYFFKASLKFKGEALPINTNQVNTDKRQVENENIVSSICSSPKDTPIIFNISPGSSTKIVEWTHPIQTPSEPLIKKKEASKEEGSPKLDDTPKAHLDYHRMQVIHHPACFITYKLLSDEVTQDMLRMLYWKWELGNLKEDDCPEYFLFREVLRLAIDEEMNESAEEIIQACFKMIWVHQGNAREYQMDCYDSSLTPLDIHALNELLNNILPKYTDEEVDWLDSLTDHFFKELYSVLETRQLTLLLKDFEIE